MVKVPIDRQILALTDEQLESFVREWIGHKTGYVKAQRFTGPGDMGRDVVGYLTLQQLEGEWHNYQCKQYGRSLATEVGIAELGKILYYSYKGEFTAPTKYYFVAPRGVNRNLKRLIAKPSEFRAAILEKWDAYCGTTIVDGLTIPLTAELRAFIEAWDFSRVELVMVDEILTDSAAKPVLQSWFGIDPGPAPVGTVPDEIELHELPYVGQLLDAYGEREGCAIDKEAARTHAIHGPHLKMQRERFFDADSFTRFYRDNTMQEEIDILRRDLHHGVAETHKADYSDTLRRVDAVMTQAANIQPSGALAKYARVPVKQGICHHFANEGVLKWRK
ncbi:MULTISPECIES: ABC-three component system protein [unclassified Mesorhizobium]|uniref:ABC-three component system protein n=1 Tax=unclassified Mesorhizobium TaxID=325217 RepID=UPI000FCB0ACC|nr:MULTISPECIES: ABC-three component system protein [unclassified Mesorhizobium]TGP27112.1 hypothetical protein EN874_005605 [Mesorhizobium sp. M1D.F.Ca.ET.231.01.1.1]TGP39070.1 hypothetical protein EN877_05605 [Mesorhizobium sp. M1D.F.Ca.ET.234.01.1.1]TGS51278.1 hypothetical protein EN827_05605 [Mesorhizobium sp. M1D.F.Ca.ET.184.01.1.1]TGS67162.1 hypothetical protein EN826_005605 [Mesorhizobium sp. M1D.F.Ca.ET.183.01.1.1]